MFFGWNGAASSNFVPAQFPYLISGGLVGLGIVVLGSALLLVQNQRTDLARLEAAVERVALAVERQGGGDSPAAALQGYVVAGGSSYHLPDCTLPEARTEAHMVPLTDIPGSNLEPCRVCRPPQFGRLRQRTLPGRPPTRLGVPPPVDRDHRRHPHGETGERAEQRAPLGVERAPGQRAQRHQRDQPQAEHRVEHQLAEEQRRERLRGGSPARVERRPPARRRRC